MAQERASITFVLEDEFSAKMQEIVDSVDALNRKLGETGKRSQEAFKPFNEAADKAKEQLRQTHESASTLGTSIRSAAEHASRAFGLMGRDLAPVTRQLAQAAEFGKNFSLALGLAARGAGGFVAAGAGMAAGLYGISKAFAEAYEKAENFRRISGMMDQGMLDRMVKARELVGMGLEQAMESISKVNRQVRDLMRAGASELATQARVLGPEWSRKIMEFSNAIKSGKMSIDEAREALLDYLGTLKDPEARRYAADILHIDPIEIERRKQIRDYQAQLIGQSAEMTAKQKELAEATAKTSIAWENLKTSIWNAIGPSALTLLTQFMGKTTEYFDYLKGAYGELAKIKPETPLVPGGGSLLGDLMRRWGITGRQHGGPVTGGRPYVVGEAGPELFMPSGSGQILASGQGPGSTLREIDKASREGNVYARETRDILAWMKEQMTGTWGAGGGQLGAGGAGAGGGMGGLPGFGGAGGRGGGGGASGAQDGMPGSGGGGMNVPKSLGDVPESVKAAVEGGFVGGGQETGGAGSNAQIAAQRGRLIKEINDNPQLRNDLANMMAHETNNPQGATAVLESLFNRTLRKGSTLARELRSGFYGPINRGEVKLGRGASPWAMGQFNAAFGNVSGGSNLIGGRDDQGMRHEIHGAGAMKVGGEWFGYMGASSREWASRQPSGGTGGGINFTTADIQRAVRGDGVTSGTAGTAAFPTARNVNVGGLDPTFLSAVNRAYSEAPESVKKNWQMISGYRPATRAEARALGMSESSSQEDIWQRSGHGRLFAAAPPGQSQHQEGRSGDFNASTADYLRRVGGRYGLTGISGDRPHIQLAQRAADRPAARMAASARARAAQLNINVAASPGSKAKVTKADGGDEFKDMKVKQASQMAPSSNVSPDEE